MSEVSLDQVLGAILDGVCDSSEDRIYAALKMRRKTVEQRKGVLFKKGDKVVFNGQARPKYLQGVEGVIEKVNLTRAIVKIGADGGRFSHSEPSCPFAIIDKVPDAVAV